MKSLTKLYRKWFLSHEQRELAERRDLHKLQLNLTTHDFSYHTGERQTGTKIEDIRKDHVDRYIWGRDIIQKILGNGPLVGGDYFCGNGYGTQILSELGTITGIDGSAEAIEVANKHYMSNHVTFLCDLYPFDLVEESHDFIVSLESVEHVADAEGFLTALVRALKPGGILIASTPNEDNFPFDPAVVPHHFRHFTLSDVEELSQKVGLLLVDMVGQRLCDVSDNESWEFCSPQDGKFQVYALQKPMVMR